MTNEQYEKRGYLLEDFRLFHLRGAQGAKTDFHYHEFCKLLLLCSGAGGYMVEGQRYSLEPGDLVLVGKRCVHRPEFPKGAPYERIILYIDPEFLRSQSAPDWDLEALFSGEGGHVLRLEEHQRRHIFALAEALEREIAHENPGGAVLSRGLLLQLLVELGRARESRSVQLPQPTVPENSRVLDLLRYLEDHLAEDITIDALAQEFFISKYHMMRLFRREMGQSIHSYLLDRRLLRARELMGQGLGATESCFRSGFRSYSSFTRAWTKRFGSTPTGRHEKTRNAE